MTMTKTTIMPPKTAGVVLLPAVLMGISCVVHEAGVVGQLHVEGCWVTITPVKNSRLGHSGTVSNNL